MDLGTQIKDGPSEPVKPSGPSYPTLYLSNEAASAIPEDAKPGDEFSGTVRLRVRSTSLNTGPGDDDNRKSVDVEVIDLSDLTAAAGVEAEDEDEDEGAEDEEDATMPMMTRPRATRAVPVSEAGI